MTSLLLKNRQTTARPTATLCRFRPLWQRLLSGVLCLCMVGGTIASDREGGKPLDRLKQRSARQRWRELRGDWNSPPETPSTEAPGSLPDAHSSMRRVPITSIPGAPSHRRTDQTVSHPSISVPVPAPTSIEPETIDTVATRPGVKPPVDQSLPQSHPGSFADTPSEMRVTTPREKHDITLPHWPFLDDLDLVARQPFEEPTDLVDLTRSESGSSPNLPHLPLTDQTISDTEALPLRVAERPTDFTATFADPVTPADTADVAQPELITDSIVPRPEKDPLSRLTPIRDIRPHFDYTRSGQTPNEYLCPLPAEADPAKPGNSCPIESELVDQGTLDRNHSIIPVYWAASNVYHNPLYFEDPGLERSGHSYSDAVQPFVSLGRFGAQVVALPYSIALDPAWKHETPLGHFRPGECAPKRHLALPLNREAAATAAAAYTGIIYLIP